MKKLMLILFLSVSVVKAADVVTIYNYSGQTMIVIDENGYQYDIPNSSACYFHVTSRVAFMSCVTYDYSTSYDLDFSLGPVATIGLNMVSFTGEWPVSFFYPGMSLGMSVSGAMLIYWIVGLLRKPVVES